MAISKRLRYEVLRRDGHACRYCGAAAPDVRLTVDHVLPSALGGTDAPENLVAACHDCNSGKTSTTPDAPLVEDVADHAARWAGAMALAAKEALEDTQTQEKTQRAFQKAWRKNGGAELPDNWRGSINSLVAAGLPVEAITQCVDIAFDQRHVYEQNRFKYMCGVGWRKIDKLRERAGEIVGLHAAPAPQEGAEQEGTEEEDDDDQKTRALYAHLGATWARGRIRIGKAPSADEQEKFSNTLIAAMAFEDATERHTALDEAALRCGLAGSANLWEYIPHPDDDEDGEELTVPITLPEIVRDLFGHLGQNERDTHLDAARADHGEHSYLAVDYYALRSAWSALIDDREVLHEAVRRLLGQYPEDVVADCMDRSLAEHRQKLGTDFTEANVALYGVTLLLKSTQS